MEYYKNLQLENIVYLNKYGISQIEHWKTINGYVNYQISNLGRVKSFNNTKNEYFKIISFSIKNKRYLQVTLSNNGIKKTFLVHRLVGISFIENPKNKPQINHLKNKFDNSYQNLEWCTCQENIKHAWETGLNKHLLGEKARYSKLKEIEVLEIRSSNLTKKELLLKYNVSYMTIVNIIKRSSWKHI